MLILVDLLKLLITRCHVSEQNLKKYPLLVMSWRLGIKNHSEELTIESPGSMLASSP